jgi:hypothetical protein
MLKFDVILGGLEERAGLGPCAKQRVRCQVTTTDGLVLHGENWCLDPQPTCPRAPGEDYTKCKTICQQLGHAEQVVARYAEEVDFTGATATLFGHTHFCQSCQEALFNAGVKYLTRGLTI